MQQLVIASNNKGKLTEILRLVEGVEVLTLRDIGFDREIPEPHHTFEENALEKAAAVHQFSGKNTFADDSGICVHALGGAPGVDSAHFSGRRDDEANLQKILTLLKDETDRSAFYKAVICLIWDDQVYYFEGICRGHITQEKHGMGGFGYDPIFIPDGCDKTFAELPLETKNQISHRGIAVRKMVDFLGSRVSDDN